MDKNKLKGKIVECGFTYKKIANLIGVSETTFTSKMNEKTKFNIDEATKIGNMLCLSEEEKVKIFLN